MEPKQITQLSLPDLAEKPNLEKRATRQGATESLVAGRGKTAPADLPKKCPNEPGIYVCKIGHRFRLKESGRRLCPECRVVNRFRPNTIEIKDGYAEMHLAGGLKTKVDIDLIPILKVRRWIPATGGFRKYVTSSRFYKSPRFLHRFVVNAGKGQHVDHINRDPLDNRRANLRFATQSQNMQNQTVSKVNKSGFKGVHLCRRITKEGKWRVRIGVNNKRIHLGYFNNKEDAALAYKNASIKYFGEFSCP